MEFPERLSLGLLGQVHQREDTETGDRVLQYDIVLGIRLAHGHLCVLVQQYQKNTTKIN